MKRVLFLIIQCSFCLLLLAQQSGNEKPRILISTDIGGTDPDDNQSMAHLLMYSDMFNIEGLVSSPSYGEGSKEEILRLIGLYEKDLPKLQKHSQDFAIPDYLRSVTKQGRKGCAPYKGYTCSTEGSDWIVECAKKESEQPLWILVWGGLVDLAQALHDAPEIQSKIKVYWIGGPNKKWSANSYAYIVENFPDLWFIEVNSSYYGFFSSNQDLDTVQKSDYYNKFISGAGHLGSDFKNYYDGEIKMGDTPSLLYLMNGIPDNPMGESWGGSFEKISHSPRIKYTGVTSLADTVAFCTILEFHFKGSETNIPSDSICFWMDVSFGKSTQRWPGYYLGNGEYGIRYIPKKAETLTYSFSSKIPEIDGLEGSIVVDNSWPGKRLPSSYQLGISWYSDKSDLNLYDGKIQGGKTILKWKNEVLLDWAKRWSWLK
jgi:hypothetical protein